jgi:uncharacterized protein
MQQVLVIHGGDVFSTQEEYLQSLREKVITLERLKQIDWKRNLQHDLGEGYEVFTPRLPNAQNARYAEWKLIFEKILPLMEDDVILIGHSLGGLFLIKFLSEEKLVNKIKALFIIAAPYSTDDYEPIVDFIVDRSRIKSGMTGGKIIFYQSKDDVVVPFENVEQYKKVLPDAEIKAFENRGHFNTSSFPELVEDIRTLSDQ